MLQTISAAASCQCASNQLLVTQQSTAGAACLFALIYDLPGANSSIRLSLFCYLDAVDYRVTTRNTVFHLFLAGAAGPFAEYADGILEKTPGISEICLLLVAGLPGY